jgi:hypothetical protein
MALKALQSSPDADEHLAERDAQRMWEGGIPDLMRVLRGLPYLGESLPQRDVEYVLVHLHDSEILPFARHRHRHPRETTGTTRISERVIFEVAATSNRLRRKWENASIEPQRRCQH